MEPVRLNRAAAGMTWQRVDDVAQRLSTHAKAEIYEVLQGMAGSGPNGDLSSLLRLEPLVNDICAQLNDGFKQAVTKRLLPEACKLLGTRPPSTAGTWGSAPGHASPGPQGAGALGVVGSQQQRQQQQHENDILALGFPPGTDQGTSSSSVTSGPAPAAGSSNSSGGGANASLVMHPPESRFAFAHEVDARYAVALQQQQQGQQLAASLRTSSYGGGDHTGADASSAQADPLLFLGLGDAGLASANGGPSEAFLLGGQLAAACGSNGGTANGSSRQLGGSFSAGGSGAQSVSSQTQHAGAGISRTVGQLSLGAAAPASATGSIAAAAGSSPYPSLPLAVRPGSSLDPGLATPPLSLSGTEPLRPSTAAVTHQQHQQSHSQQHLQQQMAAAAATPAPLFGGAPGPSPGGVGAQQRREQQQHQLLQQQLLSQHAESMATNGNGLAAYHQQQQQKVQQQQMQQQQMQQHQQQQQQQQLQYLQQYSSYPQQLLQPRSHDGSAPGFGGYTAAPDGPRASLDGRSMQAPHDHQQSQQQQSSELHFDLASLSYGGGGAGSDLQRQQLQQLQLLQQQQYFGGAERFTLGGGGSLDNGLLLPRGLSGMDSAAVAGGENGRMYGMIPLPTAAAPDMRTASISSTGSSGLPPPPPPPPGLPSSGRSSGSPPMMMMAAAGGGAVSPPLMPGGGGRSSRSGAASTGSAAPDSRSSSFSAGGQQALGGGGGGRGSASGAAPQYQLAAASPPASDASGPSSVASSAPGASSAPKAPTPMGGPMSMAAKLQQVAAKPVPVVRGKPAGLGITPMGSPGGSASSPGGSSSASAAAGARPPADMPGRFRCLPPPVQARIHTLTRDNHVVLQLKDFDEKVLSKMTLLVDKFGAGECLAMLDRIEEVLKGKAGRLANGPGYLDVSVSTRLDELKQRASGQVTAPEDYARSTLHSRIYAELRDLIGRHGFLQWHHFDQGIINMLKKMPNATALERLNELAYHSFKNVENPKSCIVSIFTTKPKYVNA